MGVLIRNDRIRGQAWRECAVCGFEYPESAMWFRRGQWVCFELDADEDLLVIAEPGESKRRQRTGVERPEYPKR